MLILYWFICGYCHRQALEAGQQLPGKSPLPVTLWEVIDSFSSAEEKEIPTGIDSIDRGVICIHLHLVNRCNKDTQLKITFYLACTSQAFIGTDKVK